MKTGKESVKKKKRRSFKCYVFFLAETSGNLCEVSLPPLPILFASEIHFFH